MHLRRCAFQDMLLVSAGSSPEQPPALSVSFACVLSQIDRLQRSPGHCARTPSTAQRTLRGTLATHRWPSRRTPGSLFTAARPFDPDSQEAQNLEFIGTNAPGTCPADDLERLHRIVICREVGVGLGSIQTLLDDSTADAPARCMRSGLRLPNGSSASNCSSTDCGGR